MLRPRIIPCLLIRKNGLVKTVKFSEPKYVGDPINAVKIFNEKEVDELIVLDIGATVDRQKPDFELVERIASECRMPLCYGGGIKTVNDAKEIITLGAEKVSISSLIFEDFTMVKKIGKAIGVQSLVAVLDIRKRGLFGDYEVFINNGRKPTGVKLYDLAERLNTEGIGEIVINSIDRDGTTNGYDFDPLDKLREITDVPLTVLGGAGCLQDISNLISKYKIIGAAAGSLFVFKGRYKAVLINYPNQEEKRNLLSRK